jgi:hypothetical protein
VSLWTCVVGSSWVLVDRRRVSAIGAHRMDHFTPSADLVAERGARRVYLAGPLFSIGERSFLDGVAKKLRDAGAEVFVPHEHFCEIEVIDPKAIFECDIRGVLSANVMLAWLDGAQVDDGTSVEIGIFTRMCAADPATHRGIVGLSTDLRLARRRGVTPGDGFNMFVAGAIQSAGEIAWSVEEAVAATLSRLDCTALPPSKVTTSSSIGLGKTNVGTTGSPGGAQPLRS